MSLEPTDITTEAEPGTSTRFTSEKARLAGIASGISRKKLDAESTVKRAKLYAIMALDMLADLIFSPAPCPHCKRKGPNDLRTFMDALKQLISLVDIVCDRLEGKVPIMSKAGSKGSIEAYREMVKDVRRASLGELSAEAKALYEASEDESDLRPPSE